MARCGCTSDRCGCNFVAGDNVTLSGSGSRSNPVVISAIVTDGGGGEGGTRFVGELVATAAPTPPAGWLVCNGAVVSRAVYADLFAAIGTAYGSGDGSTTFNLPNFVDRFVLGASGTKPRGSVGGAFLIWLTDLNIPAHLHDASHNHAAFANSNVDGPHTHTNPSRYSTVDGTDPTTYRTGQLSGSTAISTSGTHTHTIDIPNITNFTDEYGQEGSTNITNPYGTAHWLIKT